MVLLPEISLHGNNKCHLLQWNSHGLEWVKSQPGSQSDGARILAFMHLPESLRGSYHLIFQQHLLIHMYGSCL